MPPHLVGTNILSALVQNTGRHVWQEAGCWGDNGQWVLTGGSVVTTGHLINISISRVIHCLLLPGPGPFMRSPAAPYTPNQGCFLPNWDVLSIPPFFRSPGRGRGCFCRVFQCDTGGGAGSLGSHTARVTTCPLSSLNTQTGVSCA